MADDPNTKPRYLITLTDEEFARLDPGRRRLYNLLRQREGRAPIEEPATDLSLKPYVPPPKLFNSVNPLARAIVNGGDPHGQLWQKLLAETEARLAAHESDPHAKRPAHRPKTLSRKIAEHATTTLLRVWDRLPLVRPRVQRWGQRTVREKVLESYGISRSEVLKLLKTLREHSH
jgi:hypothetical protein